MKIFRNQVNISLRKQMVKDDIKSNFKFYEKCIISPVFTVSKGLLISIQRDDVRVLSKCIAHLPEKLRFFSV